MVRMGWSPGGSPGQWLPLHSWDQDLGNGCLGPKPGSVKRAGEWKLIVWCSLVCVSRRGTNCMGRLSLGTSTGGQDCGGGKTGA